LINLNAADSKDFTAFTLTVSINLCQLNPASSNQVYTLHRLIYDYSLFQLPVSTSSTTRVCQTILSFIAARVDGGGGGDNLHSDSSPMYL